MRERLAGVPLIVRQIFYVNWIYIVIVVGMFGALCFGFARELASRITSSFRQTVAPVRMVSTRTGEGAQAFPLSIREAARGVRGAEVSPFQFRLPPPACL